MFHWIISNWLLLSYVAIVLAAWGWGGWRLALGVATLGGGVLLYRQGHKDAEARADRVEQEREDAYDEIDRRGTTPDDVRQRMHDGSY